MISQIISHYEILEMLGEGGMGIVYRSQDLKLNRIVALKFQNSPRALYASGRNFENPDILSALKDCWDLPTREYL